MRVPISSRCAAHPSFFSSRKARVASEVDLSKTPLNKVSAVFCTRSACEVSTAKRLPKAATMVLRRSVFSSLCKRSYKTPCLSAPCAACMVSICMRSKRAHRTAKPPPMTGFRSSFTPSNRSESASPDLINFSLSQFRPSREMVSSGQPAACRTSATAPMVPEEP